MSNYNTTYTAYVDADAKTFKSGASGTVLPPSTFTFGDRISCNFTFDTNVIAEDDELLLVIDDDYRFYGEAYMANLPAMSYKTHVVTNQNASDKAASFTLSTRFPKFRASTNRKDRVIAVMTLSLVKRTTEGEGQDAREIITVTPLAESKVICKGLLQDYDDPMIEMDIPHYYTKAEIDAIATTLTGYMRATLDAKLAVDDIKTTIEGWKTTVQGWYNNVNNWQGEVSRNKSAVAEMQSTIEGWKSTISGWYDSIDGWQQQVSTDKTAIGNWKTAVKGWYDQIVSWYGQIYTWQAAVSSKHGEVSGWYNDISGWKTSVETWKGKVYEWHTQVNTWQGQVSENKAAAETAMNNTVKLLEGTDEQVAPLGVEHSGKEWANIAKGHADNAKEKLEEFKHRLSTAYVYGIDWKDADILAGNAGQCVVLNNIYDNAQYDKSLRYMQTQAHGVLKAHNFRRCVCSSARNVNYYLHQSNSNLKADGVTPSVLTGADGDVMSEIGITYYRVDTYTDDNSVPHTVWLVSDQPFNGSQPFTYFYVSPDGKTLRKQYVGAFRSTICDADGNTLNNNFTATTDTTYAADKTYYSRSANVFTKLTEGTDYTIGGDITQGNTVDSKIYVKTVVSSPTGYTTGRKCRSVAGAIPSGNITRANFRAAHGNNGYDSIHFLFGSYIGMMMAVEYGNFNAQASFSAGYSNLSAWDFKSMRLTGRTAIFGNNSGEIIADDADETGEDYDLLSMKSGASLWSSGAQSNHAQRIVQCSYHGIEDPFGSQFTLDEGIQKNQDAIDLSITYNGNEYLRDEADDPNEINMYCWMTGTTKCYTTSDTPEVGLNLYGEVAMTSVKGTVASVEADYSAITVGTTTYTRSAANDTTGHSYAWKNGADVIYSHVVNPHTDAATRQVFSDAQLTGLLGNVSAVADDYSESGYWMTHATSKYSMLDTNRGRLAGDEYVFPATGYTGEEIVWVHHEWPKGDTYPSFFDRVTFLPKYRTGNWGSTTKGLCDRCYNTVNAGACVLARGGYAYNGGTDGPFFVYVTHGLSNSNANYGSRSAA